MSKIKFLVLAPFLVTMYGCSSSSDSTPTTTSPASTAVSGLFLDAEVEGLSFATTSGITGITDANGTYSYLPGEDVSFSVGGVDLGIVTGAPICSPFDFGAASINIARFIQSLDADGDPTNGIDIVAANTALANTSISSDAFIGDDATFTANPDIAAALVITGDTLIDASTAENNLIAGTDFIFDPAELENTLFVVIDPTSNNIGIISFDTAASGDAFDVSVAETTEAGGDGLRLDAKWSIDSNGVLVFTDVANSFTDTVTRRGGSSRSISVTRSGEVAGVDLPRTWLKPLPVTVANLGGDGVTVTSKTYDVVDIDGSTFSETFNSDGTLANGLGGTFAVDVEAPGVITTNENEFPNETAFMIILNGNLNVVGETVNVLAIGTDLIGGTPADPVRSYFVIGVGSLTLRSPTSPLVPCTIGDAGGFINSFATFETAVSDCSTSARAITEADIVGKTWISSEGSTIFRADGTGSLNSIENFTWTLDGTYLEMRSVGGTFYDVFAIVDEKDNSISVKVYNEDGDLVRDTGNDGDIWSAVITITEVVPSSAFPINLVGKTATSIVTTNESGCEGVTAGWTYTFTDTDMTRTGSDGFDNVGGVCTPSANATQSITMTGLASDFDIPFNCLSYPVCNSEDFNKVINDIDSTSTYAFDPTGNVLTYIDAANDGRIVTEVISLN